MLGPMLSYKAGIPRIDNPLTILLLPTALLIFALESKRFNGKAGRMLAAACHHVRLGRHPSVYYHAGFGQDYGYVFLPVPTQPVLSAVPGIEPT